jgi:mRNA-degrading endonuclease toxin of MazEF toxin-antitoxin module
MVRREVFRLRAPSGGRSSEQAGERYAVVVQADELLALSTVLVAPTSRSAPPRSFRRDDQGRWPRHAGAGRADDRGHDGPSA